MRTKFLTFDSKSKEAFNTAQLGALLARRQEYLLRLPFDSNGADILAYNPETLQTIPIQIKSRMSTSKKYVGKGIYIAFPVWTSETCQHWYLLEHDTLVELWGAEKLDWTTAKPSKEMLPKLEPHSLGSIDLI
jgi:hypothetical protein